MKLNGPFQKGKEQLIQGGLNPTKRPDPKVAMIGTKKRKKEFDISKSLKKKGEESEIKKT